MADKRISEERARFWWMRYKSGSELTNTKFCLCRARMRYRMSNKHWVWTFRKLLAFQVWSCYMGLGSNPLSYQNPEANPRLRWNSSKRTIPKCLPHVLHISGAESLHQISSERRSYVNTNSF
jgi:hypothetical protein